MPELEVTLNPDYNESDDSEGFSFITPVADNEDTGYMDFVQYLCL